MLKDGDYRWFERSFGTADLPEHLQGIFPESEHGYTDIGEVFRRSFKYTPSHEEIGLQLADVLTSAIRRALIGNLHKSGMGIYR
jgi:Protein of unknown function (DUF3800)